MIERHNDSVHEGKKSFQCNLCGIEFSHQDAFKRHLKKFHNEKKQLQFKWKTAITSENEVENLSQCIICARCFGHEEL